MINDPLLLLLLALVLIALIVPWGFWRGGQRRVQTPPPKSIVVDGSNVMHWGGDPSAKVLSRVLRDLEEHGLTPIVYFDANVGYVLGDAYFDEVKLASLTKLSVEQICVVGKGVVADEKLLAFAADHGLRVVSNDRYRDWRLQFPHLKKKGRVLRGTYDNGNVRWRGAL